MPMLLDQLKFQQVVFFEGSEYIPDDVLLDLEHVRQWALKTGLIWEAESQLVIGERLNDIATVVKPEDELGIAIVISKENTKLEYLEYPYLTVRSLIARGTEVPLLYWRIIPAHLDIDDNVKNFREVKSPGGFIPRSLLRT